MKIRYSKYCYYLIKMKKYLKLCLDDLACKNHQCKNGATCIENGTGYKCQCENSGYSGKYCENCNSI